MKRFGCYCLVKRFDALCFSLFFTKVSLSFSCKLPKSACSQKFAFAQRSGAMKAPVGLLSDRTVLRSKMEGPRPDKFAFAKRSTA